MDYQSNNQSGDPQNTGEPYPNSNNSGNPYDNVPVNNGNPYGNAETDGSQPQGNTPYRNENPYGGPHPNAPYGNGNAYHNGNPYQNGNPYYNQNPYGGMNASIIRPQKMKGEGMATASMVLGIISLVSLVLLRIYIPFLVGGIGIILAILSKGSAKKMMAKAKAGMICCITGLVLDVSLCVFSVYLVFALPDIMPEMVDEVNQMCEDQYGVTYEEILDEMYEMMGIEH